MISLQDIQNLQIKLLQDPQKPSRFHILTPNPGNRYNHYWGCVVAVEYWGWQGFFSGNKTQWYSDQNLCVYAVIQSALELKATEEFGAEYDQPAFA